MAFKKADIEDQEKFIEFYRRKSIDELKLIKPLWAIGMNAHEIYDHALRQPNEEFKICRLDLSELTSKAYFQEVDLRIAFTGKYPNDWRVACILAEWENNQVIDPPSVYLSEGLKRTLQFFDGRHRTKTAYLLGDREIPIAISADQLDELKQILTSLVLI